MPTAPGAFDAPDDAALFADHLTTIRARYEGAMTACEVDTLVIDAGTPAPWYRDDIAGDWRPNPHFRLFTPCTPADGCTVVLRAGAPPVLLQLAPDDYWHLPPAAPQGAWTEAFDIRQVADEAARETLIDALATGQRARIGPGTDDAPPALLAAVDHARAAKTRYELACLRIAARRAAAGHQAAETAFRAGESEYGIQLAYLAATAHEDAELPYRNIVALDAHGAVLHYQFKDRGVPAGGARSFLIDAGADVAGYAADVTRSYVSDASDASHGSGARDAFAALIDAMDVLQRTLVAEILPGLSWPALHHRCHELLAGVLTDAQLLNCDATTALESGLTQHFMPHGLGHLIGTQTHDVGGQFADASGRAAPPPPAYPALRLTRELAADWVVTVEPGLYFIPMLLDELRAGPLARHLRWAQIDALRPFGGIRIEDNVRVIGGDGASVENLTRDAFRELGA